MKTWMFQKTGLMAPATESPPAGGGTITATPDAGKEPVASPEAIFGSAKPAVTETPTTKPEVVTPEPTKVETAAPSAPISMSEEQLQKLAQTMVAGMKPAEAPKVPVQDDRPMTPQEQAEFDKEFNVVRVTPQLFQSILGFAPENAEQLKALETFAHGIVKQAAAMTMWRVQQFATEREGKLRESLSPVVQHHQETQAKKLEDAFFTKHADLKDFGGLVQEVALAEKARGTIFKSHEEAIDYVANKARTLLGNRAPSGTTQTSTTQQNKSTQKPSMPTTSVGGRSGSGGSPQPASGPKAVFGDLDGNRS